MSEGPTGPSKPLCRKVDALAVLARLRSSGHVAYFAGGCVRDLALGLEPKDYDIATDAPPKRVRELFTSTQAVGQAFGVILVRQGPSVVEVATFRTDGDYADGRHPDSIRFSSAQEDAQRRDFTINGLFLDPEPYKIIDYVGGLDDLNQRVLRAIGDPDKRFNEDHLRLLRAVRFAARFDLTIEPKTADALRRHAGRLIRVSPERIADELRHMLTATTRNKAWEMLWHHDLVHPLLRFIELPPAPRFDPARAIFPAIAPGEAIAFGLALAAACLCPWFMTAPAGEQQFPDRSIAARMVHAMRKALKISNDESSLMKGILEQLRLMLDADPPTLAMKKRLMADPAGQPARQLLAAMASRGLFAERASLLESDFAALALVDCAPEPFVDGERLIAAGLSPGPAFKHILRQVYDAQLEGRVTGQTDALAMALFLAAEHK
jgi:poly(A) polymerase